MGGAAPAVALARFEQAELGWPERAVLSGVDLEIARGERLGIAGPNGAGKTTLVRTLLGLLAPRAGLVQVAPARRAHVPQGERLDPIYPLSVLELVRTGAYARLAGGRLARADRDRARTLIAEVGLAAREHRAVGELSGGELQRALLARALLADPELLALDEPTSAADTEAQAAILALVDARQRAAGFTLVVVAHDARVLRALANDVLWVAGGRVVRRSASEFAQLAERAELSSRAEAP